MHYAGRTGIGEGFSQFGVLHLDKETMLPQMAVIAHLGKGIDWSPGYVHVLAPLKQLELGIVLRPVVPNFNHMPLFVRSSPRKNLKRLFWLLQISNHSIGFHPIKRQNAGEDANVAILSCD